MVLDRETVSAEFADHLNVIGVALLAEWKIGVRVVVLVDNIADGPEVAAARDVNQPGWIALCRPFANIDCTMLPPGFVCSGSA